MRKSICAGCGAEVAQNKTFVAEGKVYCELCLSGLLGMKKVKPASVSRAADPTVCVKCGHDNGEDELRIYPGAPLCENCFKQALRYPFPLWIKISAIALLIAVAAGFWFNLKYFQAYAEFREATIATDEGDIARAAPAMRRAANRLPSIAEFSGLADLYEGILFLSQDKPEEALSSLKRAETILTNGYDIQPFILVAEVGAAFNRKDYRTFYDRARDLSRRSPDDWISMVQVASAAACLYAETDDEQFRDESLSLLESAKNKLTAGQEEAFAEYEARVRYRLETKEIITAEEFHRRFPNGYQGESR